MKIVAELSQVLSHPDQTAFFNFKDVYGAVHVWTSRTDCTFLILGESHVEFVQFENEACAQEYFATMDDASTSVLRLNKETVSVLKGIK